MVINHLLTGMIRQVGAFFVHFGGALRSWARFSSPSAFPKNQNGTWESLPLETKIIFPELSSFWLPSDNLSIKMGSTFLSFGAEIPFFCLPMGGKVMIISLVLFLWGFLPIPSPKISPRKITLLCWMEYLWANFYGFPPMVKISRLENHLIWGWNIFGSPLQTLT